MSGKTFSIQIGQFECIVVNEGMQEVGMDWILERFTAPEADLRPAFDDYVAEFGAYQFAMNPLVIKTKDYTILVDSGLGHTAPPHLGKLQENLTAIGIKPSDIDIVVISHADQDHIFGLTDSDNNIIFPNAGYIMSTLEWEFRNQEGNPEILRCLHKIEDKLTLIPMDAEIISGVYALPADGSSSGANQSAHRIRRPTLDLWRGCLAFTDAI